MVKRYVVSLMAANRVGILAAVTNALAELGGDLQEVSQTVMQRFFTIILAADFPADLDPAVIVEHIRGACPHFEIEVALKDVAVETLQAPAAEGTERYFLSATGTNEPGVIRAVSGRLAQEGIDVTDLYAVRSEAADSFRLVMELAVPPGVDALELKHDLEILGAKIGLAVALQHENIFTATNDPRPVRITIPRRTR